MEAKKIYDLLDDCHTAITKSTLDDKQYNELSLRILQMKKYIKIKTVVFAPTNSELVDNNPYKSDSRESAAWFEGCRWYHERING